MGLPNSDNNRETKRDADSAKAKQLEIERVKERTKQKVEDKLKKK